MKFEIFPSILSANFANLEKEIRQLEEAGIKHIHFDVMDGNFVDNISFGEVVLKSVRKISDLYLDIHLMVNHPKKFINQLIDAGANGLSFHIESLDDFLECFELAKRRNVKVFVAIKPKTDVNEIKKHIEIVDGVLIMSVEPGFGGQKFMEESIKKIEQIKKINSKIKIQVDGGINQDAMKKVLAAGAEFVVVGNSIFSSKDVKKSIIDLRNCVKN